MTTTNLLVAVTTVQWIFLGIAALGAVALLCVFVYFIYLMVAKPELKAEIGAMEKLFKEERKRIAAEKEYAKAEIKRSSKVIDEKAEKARKLELETEQMRRELMQQGIREEEAKEIANMTLDQLFALKDKERKDVSGDFVINAVTRKILIDSTFEQRQDVQDFKVPEAKTLDFAPAEVEKYLLSLFEVTHTAPKGKSAATFKILGKTFALLYDLGDGKFKLTVKCGPYYGQRLSQLYPEFFRKATFPYGMIWFNMDNLTGGCSFELVRLLVGISYNIAKAGY